MQQLANLLKAAGFPQIEVIERPVPATEETAHIAFMPSLSRLLDACSPYGFELFWSVDGWLAYSHHIKATGATPEEAVAQFWLLTHGTK